MRLNLHVIRDRLAPLQFFGTPREGYLELPFACALPFSSEAALRPWAVYVARAQDLAGVDNLPAGVGIACIGQPPQAVLSSKASVIYSEGDYDPGEVLARIAETFAVFETWGQALTGIVMEHEPPTRFGAVSRSILPNPFFVASYGLKVLFHETEVLKTESREEHTRYCTLMSGAARPIEAGGYPPAGVMHDVVASPTFDDLGVSSGPGLYCQPGWPYRTIVCRIGTDDSCKGFVCIDEVLHAFNGADYAIAGILAGYVEHYLRDVEAEHFARSAEENRVLSSLLSHRFVEERAIDDVVRGYGWKVTDRYVCMVIEGASLHRGHNLFGFYAPLLSEAFSSRCYITFGDRLVFVVNLDALGMGLHDFAELANKTLEDNMLIGGMSRQYADFKNLYYYHRQGGAALGLRVGARAGLLEYEDIAARDLLVRCRRDDPPEALFPEGLLRLLDYDRRFGTDLTTFLRVYLDARMSTTETARRTFTARNTCFYRVKRIQEISGADLDDPEQRLCLEVGLRLLEAQTPA